MIIPSKYRSIVDKYKWQVPVNLASLAKELGLDVFLSTLAPGISGLIEPSNSSPSGYQIKINRHESIVRQRFTLAHEISHFLLHRFDIGRGVIDNTMYRSNLSDKKEVEANKLAAQIIMPKVSIDKVLSTMDNLSRDETIEYLARRFKVSKEAMRIKLGY